MPVNNNLKSYSYCDHVGEGDWICAKRNRIVASSTAQFSATEPLAAVPRGEDGSHREQDDTTDERYQRGGVPVTKLDLQKAKLFE